MSKKTGLLVPSSAFADPSRFTSLAVFYAQLANSDAVRAQVKGLQLGGTYSASPVANSIGGGLGAQPITQLVPLIQVDGFARTPSGRFESQEVSRRPSGATSDRARGEPTYLRSSGSSSRSCPLPAGPRSRTADA